MLRIPSKLLDIIHTFAAFKYPLMTSTYASILWNTLLPVEYYVCNYECARNINSALEEQRKKMDFEFNQINNVRTANTLANGVNASDTHPRQLVSRTTLFGNVELLAPTLSGVALAVKFVIYPHLFIHTTNTNTNTHTNTFNKILSVVKHTTLNICNFIRYVFLYI